MATDYALANPLTGNYWPGRYWPPDYWPEAIGLVAPGPVGFYRLPLALQLYESATGGLLADWTATAKGVRIASNEHGYQSLEAFIPMTLEAAFRFYDAVPGRLIHLNYGGGTVWAGRVEDRKLVDGGLEIVALGHWRALSDAPYTALWSSKSYAGMIPVTGDMVSGYLPERWQLDNNNRIFMALVNGETYNNNNHYGGLVFRNPHRGERKIQVVGYDYDIDLPTDWKVELVGYDEGFASGAVEWTFASAGAPATGSQTVTLAAQKDFVVFRVYNSSGIAVTFAGQTASKYAKITGLRVKSTTSASLYADEIVKSLVDFMAGVNPGQLATAKGLIQSPGVDLVDEVYADQSPAQIIGSLAWRGDSINQVYEAGVWDGQTMYFRPKGSAALAWFTDAISIEIDSSLDALYNSAYAVYADANNRRLRTAMAEKLNSQAIYGLVRRAWAGTQTTSQTTAERARDALLTDRADLRPKAVLMMAGLYDASGARWPLWMARTGDTLTLRNLTPGLGSAVDQIRTFRIGTLLYDVDADLLSPGLEVESADLAALVGRVAGVIGQGPPIVPGGSWNPFPEPPPIINS